MTEPPPDYYRDVPLIRQVANDVKNGIASPLAAAMLYSLANFAETVSKRPQTPEPTETGEPK